MSNCLTDLKLKITKNGRNYVEGYVTPRPILHNGIAKRDL